MSARLDALLRVATIADVLRLANVAPPSCERKAICCPLHDENSPSFQIQASGRGFRCFGCNAHGGIIELAVALQIAPDKARAVDRLCEHFHIAEENDAAPTRRRPSTAFILPPLALDPTPDVEALARVGAALCDREPLASTAGAMYLEGRGIDPAAAAENDVRYHANWLGRGPAVVFAIRNLAGRVVAAQGRFIASSTTPKAMTIGTLSAGVYRTAAAFDVDVVAITEAPIDALSIAVSGLPALALCGTSLPGWLRRALAFRTVIVATDADAAGNAAAQKITNDFNLGSNVRRMTLPDGAKDANALLVRDPDALYRINRETRACQEPDFTHGSRGAAS